MAKRGRKKAPNPYFNNKDKALRVELEREWYEEIEVKDPVTGKITKQKVKVQRFKSPYQMGRAVLGSSDSILSRAEKFNDTFDDDDNISEED